MDGTRSLAEDRQSRARWLVECLAELYPDAACELDHRDVWELLVATLLSAQTTDVRVNQVTPELFARFPSAAALARADAAEVEELIRPLGLHRSKAQALVATAARVKDDHGGTVPADLAALTALPGVGPKTAKVVLGEAFSLPVGVVVDTHVARLARRLGLASATDAEVVAGELEAALPRDEWIAFGRRLIRHGRQVCSARGPACAACGLAARCPRVGVPQR